MVKIYTIENCPYCMELKNLLTNEGIAYTEVDVNKDENQAEFDKIYEVSKCNDVPMVRVGNQLLVPNISFKSLTECFQLTKQFLV
jgi:glutaredoxin